MSNGVFSVFQMIIEEKDEIGVLLSNIKNVGETLVEFNEEMFHMSKHDLGDIDVRINSGKFLGAFQTMAEGVNNMVFGHINVKKKAMACFEQFGEGNFDAPSIEKTAELVQNIVIASEEQELGIRQVNNAMTELSDVTQQNTSNAEELSSGSEELASQAEQLNQVMTFFKLENSGSVSFKKSNGGIMKSKVSSTSKANIEEVSHDADFENF